MEKIPQGRHTKEFRKEAARVVLEGGLSAGQAAQRLSLPKSTLETWVRATKAGKLGNIGKDRRPLTEVEIELANNLLSQNVAADAPNQVWLTDITYIPTDEGWLYLAGHKDICTGEIVGYSISSRMTKNLVSESLLKAVTVKWPAAGLIHHHSARGNQYCSREHRKLLQQFKMHSSMSHRATVMTTPRLKASGAP